MVSVFIAQPTTKEIKQQAKKEATHESNTHMQATISHFLFVHMQAESHTGRKQPLYLT